MRVLNEELKNRIISRAIDEFYLYGFEKASLRKIVKESGTTIGNFYNYFKSKEELYYLITDPVYNNLVYYMKNHNNDNRFDLELPISYDVLRLVLKELLQNIVSYEKPLIILLTGSRKTKHEMVWQNLLEVFSEHLNEHLQESMVLKKMEKNSIVTKSLAHGFLEGALYVLKENISMEDKLERLTDFFIIYFVGMLDILEK